MVEKTEMQQKQMTKKKTRRRMRRRMMYDSAMPLPIQQLLQQRYPRRQWENIEHLEQPEQRREAQE